MTRSFRSPRSAAFAYRPPSARLIMSAKPSPCRRSQLGRSRGSVAVQGLNAGRARRAGRRKHMRLHPTGRGALRVGDLDPALIARHDPKNAAIREGEQRGRIVRRRAMHAGARHRDLHPFLRLFLAGKALGSTSSGSPAMRIVGIVGLVISARRRWHRPSASASIPGGALAGSGAARGERWDARFVLARRQRRHLDSALSLRRAASVARLGRGVALALGCAGAEERTAGWEAAGAAPCLLRGPPLRSRSAVRAIISARRQASGRRSALRPFDRGQAGSAPYRGPRRRWRQDQKRNDELVDRRISPSPPAISAGKAATACQTAAIIDLLRLISREPSRGQRSFGKASRRKRKEREASPFRKRGQSLQRRKATALTPVPMLTYKEYDNAQAVEIVLEGGSRRRNSMPWPSGSKPSSPPRPCARARDRQGFRGHGRDRLLARHQVQPAACQGVQPLAIVCQSRTRIISGRAWSRPSCSCEVEHFAPGEEDAARDWLMWPEGAADV